MDTAGTPIRTILVPTGFSELSRHAARYARTLAPALRARVIVLHSIETAAPTIESSVPLPATMASVDTVGLIAAAQAGVARFIAEELPGITAEARVGVGPPGVEIVSTVRREGIDLIVMGTHARGVLNRLVFGSISKSVLESSPCPVLLVPMHAQGADSAAGAAPTGA